MNQRKAKRLRKVAKVLALLQLKSQLIPEEAVKVTEATLEEFEKFSEGYVFDGEKLVVAPFSSRYFYKKLKSGWS